MVGWGSKLISNIVKHSMVNIKIETRNKIYCIHQSLVRLFTVCSEYVYIYKNNQFIEQYVLDVILDYHIQMEDE